MQPPTALHAKPGVVFWHGAGVVWRALTGAPQATGVAEPGRTTRPGVEAPGLTNGTRAHEPVAGHGLGARAPAAGAGLA